MTRSAGASNVRVAALLESGRAIPELPSGVRARVLARARAQTTSGAFRVYELDPPRARRYRRPRLLALAAVLVVGIACTVFALSGTRWFRRAERLALPLAANGAAANPVSVALSPRQPPPPAPAVPSAAVEERVQPQRAQGTAKSPASYQDELELMRSAHSAFAARAFGNALVLVAEHARRHPTGLLAEEREALRVKCLVGSGRTREARRAAVGFAARFPRSVLLPRIREAAGIAD